jgi:hypothetical protein
MGKTRDTGFLTNGLWQDASNNIGIGGSPSGSYKFEVTGNIRGTGTAYDLYTSSGLGTSAASGLLRVITAGTSSGIAVGQANSSRYTSILANEFVVFNDDASIRTNGAFPISLGTNNTGRLFVTSIGRVGVNTSSPAALFEVRGTGNSAINSHGNLLVSSGGTATQVADTGGQISFGAWLNGDLSVPYPVAAIKGVSESSSTDVNKGALLFCTMNSTTNAEKMRLTSDGYLKVRGSDTTTAHNIFQSINNFQTITNTHTGSSPYGVEVAFTGADPNNGTNWGLGFYTTNPSFVWIYRIYSNGTVAGRSDARWKKNIETTRNGYLEDLCKLRVVKYNWYNHEENAPKELGLIAQEVEEVFPNLISYDKVTTKKQVEQEDGTFIEQEVEDGESRSIKVSVLPYMLLKALQEANAKIEELSAKVSALENKS